jgi:hypothetical protein
MIMKILKKRGVVEKRGEEETKFMPPCARGHNARYRIRTRSPLLELRFKIKVIFLIELLNSSIENDRQNPMYRNWT